MEKLKLELLALLEEDARFTTAKLANMTSAPQEMVETAIAQMQECGLIIGYTAIVNSDMLSDEKVRALIEVRVTPVRDKGFDSIAEEIVKFSEVESVFLMSGGYDLTVVVSGKTLKAVAQFVSERLSTLENVVSTTTHFILKNYKQNGMLVSKKMDKRITVNP